MNKNRSVQRQKLALWRSREEKIEDYTRRKTRRTKAKVGTLAFSRREDKRLYKAKDEAHKGMLQKLALWRSREEKIKDYTRRKTRRTKAKVGTLAFSRREDRRLYKAKDEAHKGMLQKLALWRSREEKIEDYTRRKTRRTKAKVGTLAFSRREDRRLYKAKDEAHKGMLQKLALWRSREEKIEDYTRRKTRRTKAKVGTLAFSRREDRRLYKAKDEAHKGMLQKLALWRSREEKIEDYTRRKTRRTKAKVGTLAFSRREDRRLYKAKDEAHKGMLQKLALWRSREEKIEDYTRRKTRRTKAKVGTLAFSRREDRRLYKAKDEAHKGMLQKLALWRSREEKIEDYTRRKTRRTKAKVGTLAFSRREDKRLYKAKDEAHKGNCLFFGIIVNRRRRVYIAITITSCF
ncbi:trichohyalin-like [Centruroides vittatus]|uniref:trichohyalin-like n=1 Tax=Centruroides vittatus TaxID=120091 RepID=UPI00350F6AE0